MTTIKIIQAPINIAELAQFHHPDYTQLVKAVVDVENEIMAIGGELHADEEQILIESDSRQENLWGINLYPEFFDKQGFIEFDSMINLRPSQNNRSRSVEDKGIQDMIIKIVQKLIVT